MNLEAVEEMAANFPDVQIIFIESGGDNLSATFSPDLADVSIYVTIPILPQKNGNSQE